jgi:hypothetical protein
MQSTTTTEREGQTSGTVPRVMRRPRILRRRLGALVLTLILGASVGYGINQITRPDVDRGRTADAASRLTATEAFVGFNQEFIPRESLPGC